MLSLWRDFRWGRGILLAVLTVCVLSVVRTLTGIDAVINFRDALFTFDERVISLTELFFGFGNGLEKLEGIESFALSLLMLTWPAAFVLRIEGGFIRLTYLQACWITLGALSLPLSVWLLLSEGNMFVGNSYGSYIVIVMILMTFAHLSLFKQHKRNHLRFLWNVVSFCGVIAFASLAVEGYRIG